MMKGIKFVAALLAGFWMISCSRGPQEQASMPTVEPLVLAAGTRIQVRTETTVSTRTAQTGEMAPATLAEPLRVGERVVAAKGAAVTLLVVESNPGGRVRGVAHLTLRLARLKLAGGETVEVRSSSITRDAHATKKMDAVKVGVGSGIGAAIGAIAGGEKGAAIGAGAGAAAGGGVVLATHGDPAVISAESVLQFSLKDPLTVK